MGETVIERGIDGVAAAEPQAALDLLPQLPELVADLALVRPATFLRMRVPLGLNPKLTAPMYRFLDESQ